MVGAPRAIRRSRGLSDPTRRPKTRRMPASTMTPATEELIHSRVRSLRIRSSRSGWAAGSVNHLTWASAAAGASTPAATHIATKKRRRLRLGRSPVSGMLNLAVLGAQGGTSIGRVPMFASGEPGHDAAGEHESVDRALVAQQAMRAARHLRACAGGVAGAVASNCEKEIGVLLRRAVPDQLHSQTCIPLRGS